MNSHRLLAALSFAVLTACGGTGAYRAPAPKASTPMPTGADLKPFDPTKPGLPRPQGLALGGDGRVFAALTNLDANYSVAGPGFLAAVVPETGAVSLYDLSGGADHSCVNSGYVKADRGNLLVTCSGALFTDDVRGRAVLLVNPTSGAIVQRFEAPTGFYPGSVVGAGDKIWVGDTSSNKILSIDRTTFAQADAPFALPCEEQYTFVPDLIVSGGDLYALCGSSSGQIVRLDAKSGTVKGKTLVGGLPVALNETGDGRIAVVNSVAGTLTLVTPAASGMTAQVDALAFGNSAATQDVRARGQFLFVVNSGSQTVQKVDLAPQGGPKVVGEVNTGNNTFPWNILPLDDDQAVVSLSVGGALAGVDFRAPAAK